MNLRIHTLNENGIAHIALILGAIVVIVVGAAGFRVMQHERKEKNAANTSQNASTDQKSELTDSSTTLNGIPLTSGGQSDQPASNGQSSSGNSGGTAGTSRSTAGGGSTAKSSPLQGSQPSSGTTGSGGNSGSGSSTPTSKNNGDTPQVTLTYPSFWGQTVSGTITMTANASDLDGVQKVIFRVMRIGYATPIYSQTDTSAPYSATFDTTTLPNGGSEYTVEAQVFDNLGTGNMASHRINIQN